jgi:hypothetical protein
VIGGCEVKRFAADTAAVTTPIRVHSCRFVVNELRQTPNKGTLRAFCNAHRFPTFKIFSPAGRSSMTCRSRSIAATGSGWLAQMGLANQPCLRSSSVMSRPITGRSRSRRTQPSDFFRRKPPFKFEKHCQLFVGGNDEPVFDCRNPLEHHLRFCRTQVGWRLARRLRCRTKVQYTAVGEWW